MLLRQSDGQQATWPPKAERLGARFWQTQDLHDRLSVAFAEIEM